FLVDPDARELHFIEPGKGSINGADDLGFRVFHAHQNLNDADALSSAKRDKLKLPRGPWREGFLVVLRTPCGELTINLYLTMQDAFDTHIECPLRPIASISI